MLLSALKNAEIDKREPLTEAEENAVVKRKSSRHRRRMTWLLQTVKISAAKLQKDWLYIRNLLRRI